MTDKVSTYVQFAQKFSKQIISSHANWTSYLNTAARMYKYQYQDQLLIYAQRPDATACAEYDLWNDVMHRYVRRGSKGIALLQTQGDQTRLRYVFDVSDTGTRRTSLDPYLWEITPHNELAIAAMLYQKNAPDPLLPAWPKEWDVEFRLPAGPGKFVRCAYRHGAAESIRYEDA